MASPRPIPFAHNSSHFVHIQNNLACVLQGVKSTSGLPAKVLWISCRLNRSKTQDMPVFVGWVEDTEAINIRLQKGQPYSPVELRFGDTHPSKLYSDCLAVPLGTVVNRAWVSDQADPSSQRTGENSYGETHRRSIPIQIDNKYVGTLNVAFLGDPDARNAEIQATLINWAQKATSPLVKYIKDNLDFSGPPHP